MPQTQITQAATMTCNRMILSPSLDLEEKSFIKQILNFVESVQADRDHNPFYEDCILELMNGLKEPASRPYVQGVLG